MDSKLELGTPLETEVGLTLEVDIDVDNSGVDETVDFETREEISVDPDVGTILEDVKLLAEDDD